MERVGALAFDKNHWGSGKGAVEAVSIIQCTNMRACPDFFSQYARMPSPVPRSYADIGIM